MKKMVVMVALGAVALTASAQSKGAFDVYDCDTFKLHVYNTHDALGDASYIIEGKTGLVTLEQPLFKENVTEYDAYLSGLKKDVVQRIADYHLGSTGNQEIQMAEGMSAFTKGPIYSGMMQNFAKIFGEAISDLPTGKEHEVAFGSTNTWAGVSFVFSRGAASDFPGASILIGGKVYFTHWAPAKAHMSHLQISSPAAIDAEIAEAEKSLQSGAVLFIGGHGGAAHADAVQFKIAYLKTLKKLVAENKTADALIAALKAAYPSLPGEAGLSDLAKKLYVQATSARPRYFMQQESDIVSQIPYGANDQVGHYVQSDDARIYYETYGKGDPVLVLHGGGVGCMYEMGRLIDELSKNYQVIAVSTRGHGRSEIGSKVVTYEQRANDALAVLKAATNRPAMVVGFSDGAYTGYKLAAMYPDTVKKLIAIGAGENLSLLRKVTANNVEAMKKLDPAFMASQMALMPEPERLQKHWNALPAFYNNMIADKKLFNSIKCPVLLISGENDPNAPLDTVIAAYRMIPDSRLAIIADAPHQVFITNFPAVWTNIEPFLTK